MPCVCEGRGQWVAQDAFSRNIAPHFEGTFIQSIEHLHQPHGDLDDKDKAPEPGVPKKRREPRGMRGMQPMTSAMARLVLVLRCWGCV